jgi:aspartate racemase
MVVTECQRQYGARHVEDFPHMLIYSLPAPFFIDRPIDHERAKQVVQNGLRRLEGTGVDFIVMPCNTAHTYYESLAASLQVPLLNIITEACNALRDFRRVAICATETTINSGLYQEGIRLSGKEPLPTQPIQATVTNLIAGIIEGRDLTQMRTWWSEILNSACGQGADAVLVACTEINALGQLEDHRIPLVDATVVLAEATVRKYLEVCNPVGMATN